MIVLTPDHDVDEVKFARKIWELFSGKNLSIVFLGMVADPRYAPEARRRLTTLAAMTRDHQTHTETHVAYGRKWLCALGEIYQDGDWILCHEEQIEVSGFQTERPLSELIVAAYQTPVYMLSGLYPEAIYIRSKALSKTLSWLIFSLMFVLFFFIELGINQHLAGWLKNTLSILAIFFQVLMIWIWNIFKS